MLRAPLNSLTSHQLDRFPGDILFVLIIDRASTARATLAVLLCCHDLHHCPCRDGGKTNPATLTGSVMIRVPCILEP